MAEESQSHSDGVKINKFCALRKNNCGHNKYQENCKPSENWGKYPQQYTGSVKDKVTKKIISKFKDARRRSYEAHHVVCVASVTGIIAKNDTIRDVVKNTKWCVNYKPNMIALPLWAHTIQWYCHFSKASPLHPEIMNTEVGSNYRMSIAPAPPFKDLPQHDYDHACYIDEIEKELADVVKELHEIAGKHEDQKKMLKDELERIVNKYKQELQTRGQRSGGTHAAWNWGMNISDSPWYLPFSMAKDGEVDERIFPTMNLSDGGRTAQKILEVAEAYWLEGSQISIPV